LIWLRDEALDHLRQVAELPDLSGTRYQVSEVLGRGGMGTVYRARDVELDREVALKVLSVPDPSSRLAERLLREARVLARLEHPGIVPVHDVGTLSDGRVFYAMKRVEGRRLDEVVHGESRLGERLRIFERLCEAVAFAHSRGVLHRDLKPENVMVGSFGEVLVMDWGLAKILEPAPPRLDEAESSNPLDSDEPTAQKRPTATAHGSILGTPGYMAPEQARGDLARLGPACDVYALGALLCFLLTGQPPPPREERGEDFLRRDTEGEVLPSPLRSVVNKALAPNPEERYGDAEELGKEVSRFLQGLRVKAHPEGIVEKVSRLASKHRLPLVLILAYLVMRILLLVILGR
jgi:serine/threonine protein kinase